MKTWLMVSAFDGGWIALHSQLRASMRRNRKMTGLRIIRVGATCLRA